MGKYLLGCGGLIIIAIIILVVAVGGFWMNTYNSLVRQKQGVDAAWANVENQYQRRADLVPNLVATVSGAANFEKSTLTAVTDARTSVGQVKLDPSQAPTNQADLDKFQAAQSSLGNALSRLLVVSENYPNLKSDQNFLDLQAQLEGTENRIATSRYNFNQSAQGYNTAIALFPASFVAKFSGFTQRPYFQATAGSQTPPTIHFDFNSTNAAPSH